MISSISINSLEKKSPGLIAQTLQGEGNKHIKKNPQLHKVSFANPPRSNLRICYRLQQPPAHFLSSQNMLSSDYQQGRGSES